MRKSLFLFFLLLTSFLYSFAETCVWDGSYVRWTKGIGIENDPFVIKTSQEFAYLSQGGSYEGKYFVVKNDIDLNNIPWTPIGFSANESFKGHIDFENHIVSGVNVNLKSDRATGLFGYIENATIRNLSVEGTVVGINYVGAIVGMSKSSMLNNIHNFTSVFSNGNFAYVGGVVGYGENTIIISCTNSGNIKNTDNIEDNGHEDPAAQSYVGGIAGWLDNDSYVNRCSNKAPVEGYSAMATAEYCVSGICGIGSNISYCYNTASVTCNLRYVRWYNDGTVAYVAGIATSPNSLNNCYNTGSVKGCSYWGGRYAGITTGPGEYIDAGQNGNFSTWDITGCQATSYTAQSEKLNGIKISMLDINKLYVINELNDGAVIYKQDNEPYLNNGLPYIDSERLINIATAMPTDVGTTGATLRGTLSINGYDILNTWFELKEKGNITVDKKEGFELCVLNNLKPNTSYISTYCVETSGQKVYRGEDVEFRTKDFSCEIYTLETTLGADCEIIINGAIIPNEDVVSLFGFEWKQLNSTKWDTIVVDEVDSYYYSSKLAGLNSYSQYQYRAFAEIDGYRRYGEILTFTTSNSSIAEINEPDLDYSYQNGLLKVNNIGHQLLVVDIKGCVLYNSSNVSEKNVQLELPAGTYIINGQKILLR